MEKTLPISVNDKFGYNIYFSFDFDDLADLVSVIRPEKTCKIGIVSDDIVAPHYLNEVKAKLSKYYNHVLTFVISHGEEHKNLDTIHTLYQNLIENEFHRTDLLVALGGGVIGDMTGFCAATYLRGIDFVQIPTTLLSQVDSSIGGKTGVDFLSYKNMVGAFHMPRLVYINSSTLSTLPDEQFASGMGEVIKYGCIQRRTFFDWLNEHRDDILAKEPGILEEMIHTSCRCKKEVVEIDPTEKGIRAWLNFGHTFGHAIEKQSNFTLFHGHCVAIGMVAAAELSRIRGSLVDSDVTLIRNTVKSFHLPYKTDGMDRDRIISAIRQDKKMTDAGIRFILLSTIGKAEIVSGIGEEEMREALERTETA